jgi:hypothetical protein
MHGTMGHTRWSCRKSPLRREATTPRLPEVIGEPSERGNLKTDQRERETMGPPTRGDSQGGRTVVVVECLGECPGQGEGPQGDENVRDRAVEAANRKGISEEAQTTSQAWRARCIERCPAGSGRGGWKRTIFTKPPEVMSGRSEELTVPRRPPTSYQRPRKRKSSIP